MFLEKHYKNEEQLNFMASLCKRPLGFHHAVEESYPEIEIHIHREFKPSMVRDLLEPVLRENGFTKEMVELEPYDNGERGYNELVLLHELNLFDNEQIDHLVSITKEIVSPYASLTDVESN